MSLGSTLRRESDSEPVRLGARSGLVANGLLHLMVAWLAVRVAFGRGERADQAGALQTVADQPFGRVLLWLVVAGFGAVVIWRAHEAIWGFRHVEDPGRRLRKRLFSVCQVLVFGVLAGLAARVAAGSSGGGGGQGITARLLAVPFGRAAVVVIGVAVLVTGCAMIVRGWQKAFTEDLDLDRAAPLARALTERTGQVGTVAKGFAVIIIGVLVGLAGLTYQPARAEGLDAALKALAGQPFGSVLLVAVAAGLASFGIYCFFDARYHRV